MSQFHIWLTTWTLDEEGIYKADLRYLMPFVLELSKLHYAGQAQVLVVLQNFDNKRKTLMRTAPSTIGLHVSHHIVRF